MTALSARTSDVTSAILAEACLRAMEDREPEEASKYYRARYYDPKIGRFISEDPIRWAGGDVNLYAYVENDPVNFVDPDGFVKVRRPPAPPGGPPANCLDAISYTGELAWRVHTGQWKDKVGHCQAHCEIVKRCGPIGKAMSTVLSIEKEHYDAHKKQLWSPRSPGWDPSDIKANDWGASCPANRSCEERCMNAQAQFP